MPQTRKFPREFLLSELRRVAKILGKIPTMQEFRRESNIAAETLAKRFKGWKGALASAGFDPSKLRLTYDDLELIEELQRVARLLGRTPTSVEFNENSELGSTTLSQRFGGSWKEACRAAGLVTTCSAGSSSSQGLEPGVPETGHVRGEAPVPLRNRGPEHGGHREPPRGFSHHRAPDHE